MSPIVLPVEMEASCKTRDFCPSCQAKRRALFAERLQQEILAPVPHRHFVFTIPKVLRAAFARDRRLLGLLSRSAFHAVKSCFQAAKERPLDVPGTATSIQTFGSYAANFHPHIHIHALVSEGLFTRDGAFLPLSRHPRCGSSPVSPIRGNSSSGRGCESPWTESEPRIS